MIEIILDDEKYLLHAKDISYINAYKSSDAHCLIDIYLKKDDEIITLEFIEDYIKYARTYELILKKMSEVQ